ncbi:aminopeptidase [Erysipelothrix sp. HDW6B]|uniref:aminopeptidase n=1 Tax=Erysipelothrix TaxID=1647 RepID=UPI00135A68EC|nr:MULTISPECIES: aminopeptidase [Erysipelothrix]QIK86059.1 aminopeptidase [Erysipelothrix sp. HDW6B]
MTLIEKYAQLAVRVGVNVQPGQTLLINVKAEHYEFARLLVKEAYAVGAKKVVVKFSDDIIGKEHALHQDLETYTRVPQWIVDENDDYLTQDLCRLSVYAPSPGLFADVDGDKLAAAAKAQGEALKAMREYTMANRGQWSLISLPTNEWAHVVFPELPVEEAYEKLLEAILYASRVTEDKDPVVAWAEHNAVLAHQNTVLNDYNFKSLHFKNSKGTDITVGLVKDHVWAGGEETSEGGHKFNPNMPTEESFTMPDRLNVNGRVYSTKPLNYSGKLIDEFWLDFVDGKVVDFDAKQEKETLRQLLDTDEGSRHIGEIALISHKSPISDLNILFYNTLFDENASCHMALGRAYPMNIKNGTSMSQEELLAHNSNDSINHEDFMFGSEDMSVIGVTQDDTEVVVFEAGNFVI